MATSEMMADSNSRVTCSVCLERFSGRQPKLLPCFHTFCSPCLSALAQATQTDGSEAACASITCPTCRTDIPVPPGGVAKFQSNFYIINDDSGPHRTPSPCQLCDGGQPAGYHCTKCGYFCSQCHRIHNKCCRSTQVTTLVLTPSKPTLASGSLDETFQNQVKVVQTALEILEHNKKEVSREKQAIEDGLNTSYTKELRLLTEVKEECLKSLKDAAETVEKKIQAEVVAAREAEARLNQLSSQRKSSAMKEESIMLSKAELKRFADCSKANGKFGLSRHSKPVVSPEEYFKSVFGTIVTGEPGKDGIFYENVVDEVPQSHVVTDDAKEDGVPLADRTRDNSQDAVFDVLKKLQLLERKHENTTSSLQSELNALKQKNGQMSSENAKLLSKVSSLEDAMKMFGREQASSKDKSALLCQDVAALQVRDVQTQKEFAALKKELTAESETRKGCVPLAQSEIASLRRSVDQHEAALKIVKSNFGKMQTKVAFHALLQTDVRVKTERVLILKHVLVNLSDGYDSYTGYFTAPVSGVYLFMATSGSFDKNIAKLDLVHEGKVIAFIGAKENSTTCHAAFCVPAGERVWLRSFGPETENDSFCFEEGWKTSFSGVLIQPDL
ncbi:uncharacterized protein [Littorina saxatilis]|uniref:uncharacterized protein n=1 Tax=Littorina saxatilis TaxID=31220 RepID=UPI0038B462F7